MISSTDFHIGPSGDHLKKMTEDCDEQDGQGDDDEDDNDDGTDVNGDDDGTDVNGDEDDDDGDQGDDEGDEDDDDSTGVDEIKSDSSDASLQAPPENFSISSSEGADAHVPPSCLGDIC